MNNDNIMMALLSTLCPPIGLMGSMIRAISSSEPDAGMGFLLDLSTAGLPSLGFVGDLAVELGKSGLVEKFTGNRIDSAANKVTPYNAIPVTCDRCRRKSNFYSRKGSEILCNKCIAEELSQMVAPRDAVIVFPRNVGNYHRNINDRNHIFEQYQLHKISEQGVTVNPTNDRRIPEFSFSYASQNNMRWTMSMWASLAEYWPASNYLALFDFSNISANSLQQASLAVVKPDFKASIHVDRGGNDHAYVAFVHSDFRGQQWHSNPDEFVTLAGYNTKSEALNWLKQYL